jgi:hypothetical protein
MDQPILGDKNQFPTDEIIFSYIGKSKPLWISLFEFIHTQHPDISEEWRYYNDGKSWLMKVMRKKKTIFWLSVIQDAFRVTFYFPQRAEEPIFGSMISDELKDQFKNGKWYNKIRGLTVTFKTPEDVEYAKTLTGIKLSLK